MSPDRNTMYTIVCFAFTWDDWERRTQQIMTRLANHTNVGHVVYVEAPLNFYSFLKFLLRRSSQIDAARWRRFLSKGMIIHHQNIHVFTPLSVLPFLSLGFIQNLNEQLLARFQRVVIKNLLRRTCGRQQPILWITNPYFIGQCVRQLGDALVCYDLCDDYNELQNPSSQIGKMVQRQDAVLTRRADILFVAARQMHTSKKAINSHTYRIPNGVDLRRTKPHCNQTTPSPALEQLRRLKRPVLGYTGRIQQRTDIDLITYVATTRPDWSIALIGTLEDSPSSHRLMECPNIRFLGPVPRRDLDDCLAEIDVCLLPHRINSVTESMNPIKLFDYLASGRPIVSTSVAGVREHAGAVRIADTPAGFVAQIDSAIRHDRDVDVQRRIAIARAASWEYRVHEMVHLIRKVCSVNLGSAAPFPSDKSAHIGSPTRSEHRPATGSAW